MCEGFEVVKQIPLPALEYGLEYVGLLSEVPIDRTTRAMCSICNHFQRGTTDALRTKAPFSGIQYLFTRF
ncbi:Uncharacterised protein [Serratia proteamaculans]|nr:Uncharacterised protein [Serratia proteamaculans]